MASITGNDRQVNSQVFFLCVISYVAFIDMNFEANTTIYPQIFFTLVCLIMTSANNTAIYIFCIYLVLLTH